MSDRFGTGEVGRILGMPPAKVRAIVQAGLCQPSRRGRRLEFSFQDLVVMRTAQQLLDAEVPPRTIKRALQTLAGRLPSDRPLSGLRICADGRDVVVRDGDGAWKPENGQMLFTFDVDDLAAAAQAPAAAPAAARPAADVAMSPAGPSAGRDEARRWFDRGVALEAKDPTAARDAYEKAVQHDPGMSDAYVNLGRLVHEQGDPAQATRLYHFALEVEPNDAVTHYNLAMAQEDGERIEAALSHYERAIGIDPSFADAHYNLGRLLAKLGRRESALRHLATFKRLTE